MPSWHWKGGLRATDRGWAMRNGSDRSNGGAGARLDQDLEAALADIHVEVKRRRLAIFREHAARHVCLASPLLLDACREDELDTAAWRLRPRDGWPMTAEVRTYVRGPKSLPFLYGAPDLVMLRLSRRA